MFFKHLEPILAPFRKARQKAVQVKQVKGNIKMDVKRVKNVKNMAGAHAKKGSALAGKAGGAAKDAQGKVQGAAPGQPAGQAAAPAAAAPPGAPGAPAAPAGAINPNPGVKKVGLFGRKKQCEQCGQELDKTWDSCPYCAQAAAAQQAAAAPAEQKTQAFMLDAAGSGAPMQLLGWLIPVKGPQRGELYTLAPVSLIGTEPTCTVVLHDQYMSSEHAEIKAEGGTWVLKDLGSTNGTFVNDKRIDQQELVDNDFVKFGQSLVKFKSL